jgi:hypothetical protein
MVIAAAWTLLAAAAAGGPDDDPGTAVRSALARGAYPWYDAASDQLRPVRPPREPAPPQVPDAGRSAWAKLGQWIVFFVLAAALAVLCIVLALAWQRHLLSLEQPEGPRRGPARAVARTADLPPGLRVETDDPWAEAVRLRDRGEHARAIVLLFLHQVLTLDRLRLSRLLPGRTGRQIVRGVADAAVRRRIEPTLRLFEAVYYGHRDPGPEAVAAAWAEAEAFQRWAAERTAP